MHCHAILMLRVLTIAALPAFAQTEQYQQNPFVIELAQPRPAERAGGILCADVDNDGRLDYLYTTEGSIGAYGHDGDNLWVVETDIWLSGQSESEGLPGLHHPGCQVADPDRDGRAEVLFLTGAGDLVCLDGETGDEIARVTPPTPDGVSAWEHLVVCNLRGEGDVDLVLQATPDDAAYKVGHHVAAFSFEDHELQELWRVDDFGALAHGPLRVADMTGDGRDEICGFSVLGPDGQHAPGWRYPPIHESIAGGASFHIDSIFLYDVRPDIPGIEAVLLEEGRNYIAVVSFTEGLLFHVTNDRQEPQNAAVGDFDPDRPGLEIWCRSRYNEHQMPWVHDAQGSIIFSYAMDDVAPEGWTTSGVEEIFTIDWTGEHKQLACAKERHTEGDVCIFDPMTGRFIQTFDEAAARLFVADVSGDWREEIIVVNDTQIRVYHNEAENPRPDEPSLWDHQWYRRAKMNWNYYSP